MARLQRLSVPGLPHLVRQQAQAGQRAIHDDEDCRSYLQCLRLAAAENGVALHAYGLTANEAHLLATPSTAGGLGAMMQDCARRYVGAHNRRHERQGSLWQPRFRTTVLEPGPLVLAAMLYVERAPLRAGEDVAPETCSGSSAATHLGAARDTGLTDHAVYWGLGNTPFEREGAYRALLAAPIDAAMDDRLAGALHKGWAVGSGAFLAALAQQAGRRVQPLPRGRPPKSPLV